MRFSIGIPAFKARFLYDCIASVLGQTYTDFELIIVNDASPEDVEGVVNNFSDKRIRYYVNEKNYGAENVVDNWNKCLSYALGDFFVLMGDDDMMESTYLEEFAKLICKYPDLDVYHCRSRIINEKSEPIGITQALPEYESVFENIWHRMNGWRLQYISDFIYRTSSLRKNGGFYFNKLAWASDDISSFIAMRFKGIAHINSPIFSYRRSRISISSTGAVELKLEAIMQEEKWYKDFLNSSTPNNKHDRILKNNIENNLSKYIKKKRIQTIVSHGYNSNQLLKDYLRWFIKRRKYQLSSKELVYSVILLLKDKEVNRWIKRFDMCQ